MTSNKNSKTILWIENDANLTQKINGADFGDDYNIVIFNNENGALTEVSRINPDIVVWGIDFSQENAFENLKKLSGELKTSEIPLIVAGLSAQDEKSKTEFKNKLEHYFSNCVFEDCDINKITKRIKTLFLR